jgi:Ca2+-binding RTX toxin-like protein
MAGSWNGDNYFGDDTNETVAGTAANNIMYGGLGDDNLSGLGGNDTLIGGVGSDQLFGGIGDDVLTDLGQGIPGGFTGIIGKDTLFGGAGDDSLRFFSVDTGDVGDGGAGFDRLLVNFANVTVPGSGSIVFALGPGGAASTIFLDGDATLSISNVEAIDFTGGTGADAISGGTANDTISGLGGNDTLNGGGGDDLIDGGTGAQLIDGGADFDVASFDISAFAGVTLTNAASVSLGAAGSIQNVEAYGTVTLGSGTDIVTLTQSLGAAIYGGGGDDQIDGGSGNDQILIGPGAAVVRGNDGNDFVSAGGVPDTQGDQLFGGAGLDALNSFDGDDLLYGGTENDILWAGNGSDRLWGGDGNDLVNGQNGADRLFGGRGDDRLDGDSSGTFSLPAPDQDILRAGDGNDTLNFGLGADKAWGEAGDDSLSINLHTGGSGLDFNLDRGDGGTGTDLLRVLHTRSGTAAPSAIDLVLGATTNLRVDGTLAARLTDIERIEVNTAYAADHRIIGGVLSDFASTSAGDDVIRLGDGDDSAFGGAGGDVIDTGAGNDLAGATVGGGDDIPMGAGADTLRLGMPYSTGVLEAGGGTYAGGPGQDVLAISGTDRPIVFDGTGLTVSGTGVGTVSGFERATISGSSAADSILGLSGDDTIDDGFGGDTVGGRAGADLFVMRPDATTDRITDWADGTDLIQLFGVSFASLTITTVVAGQVQIAGGGDTLLVLDGGAGTLTAGHFGAGDFIFT